MLNPCIILNNLVRKNISEALKYTVAHVCFCKKKFVETEL